ncbi:MAG TPA: signal peptidase I [Iamia sp.]|nr:signal peptidase I [Iamia sp.]
MTQADETPAIDGPGDEPGAEGPVGIRVDLDKGSDGTEGSDGRDGAEAIGPETDDEAVDDDSPEAVRRRRIRSGVEWVAVIAGAVIIALVVRTFLFTTFWIPSGSMEPTLMGEGRRDRVVVNRLAYQWGEPGRGDIIVFEVPETEAVIEVDGQVVHDLIKRVIGLPGETVELRDGEVFIDGEKLDEPYLPDGTQTLAPDPSRDTFVVPEDCVFVMGDNRGASRDARFWQTPCVPEGDIVGKAFIRIWPLDAFGGI